MPHNQSQVVSLQLNVFTVKLQETFASSQRQYSASSSVISNYCCHFQLSLSVYELVGKKFHSDIYSLTFKQPHPQRRNCLLKGGPPSNV